MKYKNWFYLFFWVICLLIMLAESIIGQSINTEFGKNRVQYHDDFSDWWQYETKNFITYWYGKSRNVAVPTLQLAEMDHDAIQKLLEHRINDKIEILVYLDLSDLKQSNIGTEETFINKTGETKIIGNKMFVYFDGNHQNLRLKIKEGIARVYFNHMLFGSTFQEIIQNIILMDIPEWYKEGIVSYAANGWNGKVEDELRDIWQFKPKLHNFKKLAEKHPRLAGHSFWYFIEQQYGRSSISNLLYLTKISRGIENSFLYVFNEDINSILAGYEKFYQQYYEKEKTNYIQDKDLKEMSLKKKGYIPVSQLMVNNEGTKLAYIQNRMGKTRLMVKDLKTGKESKYFHFGYINEFQETDYNYPCFTWFPNEDKIAFIYENKDIIRLRIIDINTKKHIEQIIPEAIQRVYSIGMINKEEYIFSGSTNGYSDLIMYKYKTRNHSLLTDDFYDDLDVHIGNYQGKKGVLFSSNRQGELNEATTYDTIVPIQNFALYFLPLDDKAQTIIKIYEEPGFNLRFPMKLDENKVTFLSDASGIINLKTLAISGKESSFQTNANRNIIRYHINKQNQSYIYTSYHDGKYKFFTGQLQGKGGIPVDRTFLQSGRPLFPNLTEPYLKDSEEEKISIPEEYYFQSNFRDIKPEAKNQIISNQSITTPLPAIPVLSTESFSGKVLTFNPSRIVTANKKFSIHKITTKFDNDILFEGLESYTGDRQQLLGTPMGFLMKANVKDLFEDFSFDVGMRLPLLLNGSEFFLVYDNKKGRTDHRFAIYRRAQAYNDSNDNQPVTIAPSRVNKISTLGLYQWKMPFTIYKSLRITSQLRFDKYIRKSTENVSFNAETINEQRAMVRTEYIYDNTHEETTNIKFGTRYKIYGEVINTFQIKLIDGFSFDLSKGLTTIFGFDARHYIPIFSRSIIAIRGAGATSFGTSKMLYYIGGMENWLFPQFNSDIPQRNDENFAYKANIGQMRGFINNIRNGTSYLVTNMEVRIPFMQYFLGKNKGSSFVRNMQVTGFFDMGMAWYGLSPYSKKNPLNTVTLSNPPIIRVDVEYFKDPAVFGVGWGFRTNVFGYFVKFDYAWGIETGRFQKPVYYITLGQDF